MTIRKTNTITALVFLSLLLLHFFIIIACFVYIGSDAPAVIQTQFVLHSTPRPAIQRPAAIPHKPSQPKPPAKKHAQKAPVPTPVREEEQSSIQDTTVSGEQTTDAAAADAVSGIGQETPVIDFKALIVQRIAEKKIYPAAARKRNQEGTVTVRIIVLKSGQLAQTEIITPSSYKFLNEAALASIRAAAPFSLDDSAPDHIELTVTIEYRLDG